MTTDPALPLQMLLSHPRSGVDEHWLTQAKAACAESLSQIEAMLDSPAAADRDTKVCLAAISKSLQWVLTGQSSPSQMTFTVRRAVQIFDRMSNCRR